LGLLVLTVIGVGMVWALSGVSVSLWLVAASLVFVGLAALTFMTASNSMMQLTTERAMRGRVLALRIAVVMGGTPLGAPLIGWIVDHYGARVALGVGALSGFAAGGVAVAYLVRHRDLRVRRHHGRWRVLMRPVPIRAGDVQPVAGERVK
jgi:MFS family permease